MPPQLPDFDTLKEIAEANPAALESFRDQLIRTTIMRAPAETRSRLRGLQFQIDSQRRLHSSPMGSCVKISSMMQDSFLNLIELLNRCRSVKPVFYPVDKLQTPTPHPGGDSQDKPSATILPFQRH